MEDEVLQRIVARIVARVAHRLGANGKRGKLIAVFTGATVSLPTAMEQIRGLLLDGFHVCRCLSPAADRLYGAELEDRFLGFPHFSRVRDDTWLTLLRESRAVVVPMLSVNTLSKISLLIADNLCTNLVLHGLMLGKPVVVARDGVEPGRGSGRDRLGFQGGAPPLDAALRERLARIESYGCSLAKSGDLRNRVRRLLLRDGGPEMQRRGERRGIEPAGRVVTGSDILRARRAGTGLLIPRHGLITPLARDLARRHGVSLIPEDSF